jgi:hypothetical protein
LVASEAVTVDTVVMAATEAMATTEATEADMADTEVVMAATEAMATTADTEAASVAV